MQAALTSAGCEIRFRDNDRENEILLRGGCPHLINQPPGSTFRQLSNYTFVESHVMDAVFKALSDPTRREILRLLSHGEKTAGELAEQFDVTKPSMSHHFAVLKEAGLIISRREGQQIWYRLNSTVAQDVIAWVMELVDRGARKRGKKS